MNVSCNVKTAMDNLRPIKQCEGEMRYGRSYNTEGKDNNCNWDSLEVIEIS